METGGEIVLGSSLFTLVEPHQGHEVAYNRWYERDHMLAGCMVGPWLYAGRRWVATRDDKALRSGTQRDLFGDGDPGTYLAVYFVIDGKHDEHFEWGTRQVHWLHNNGRMFAQRDHIHTLLYRFGWAAARDTDGVPKELALDHPYSALVATFVERADGVDWRDLEPWFAGKAADTPGVGQTLLFRPIPLPESAPVTQKGMGNLRRRSLLLRFADVSPAEAAAQSGAVDEALAAEGLGSVLWSSPFRPTIPGTDTYTDQLW
ncbi:MAG: hypothetical protein M3527_03085 [Actinomycetota bacterium]|nr:hypothetical protein [Acidimicrobiia bacterium]MDQ3293423.1 hypothetical protein [Actinomycetota bacterium]